jgi:hypothetical protein
VIKWLGEVDGIMTAIPNNKAEELFEIIRNGDVEYN